jgi:hypothetical protein
VRVSWADSCVTRLDAPVGKGAQVSISIAATLPAQLAKRIADDLDGGFIAVGGDWRGSAGVAAGRTP